MAYIYNKPIYGKNGQIISYYSGPDTGYATEAAALGGSTSPTSSTTTAPPNTSTKSTSPQPTSSTQPSSSGKTTLYWGGSNGSQAFLAGSALPLTSITLGNGEQVFVGPDGTYYSHDGSVLSPAQIASAKQGTGPISVSIGAGSNAGDSSGGGSSSIAYSPSWAQYGVSEQTWNSLNAVQQGVVGAALEAGTSLYSTGSTVTLSDALAAAAQDPNIIAKYSDALKLDTQAFQQNIETLRQTVSSEAQQQAIQFQKERQALASSSADAGQAYSGFRKLAEGQLAETESAVIQSTNAQNQAKLQDLVSSYEAKYGSAATSPASLSYIDPISGQPITPSGLYGGASNTNTNLTANPLGGITGTQPLAKQADILSEAEQSVAAGQVIPTKPA